MISPELEKMAAAEEYKGIAFCKVDVVSFELGLGAARLDSEDRVARADGTCGHVQSQ
jgi:hypothetical protein